MFHTNFNMDEASADAVVVILHPITGIDIVFPISRWCESPGHLMMTFRGPSVDPNVHDSFSTIDQTHKTKAGVPNRQVKYYPSRQRHTRITSTTYTHTRIHTRNRQNNQNDGPDWAQQLFDDRPSRLPSLDWAVGNRSAESVVSTIGGVLSCSLSRYRI